MISTFFTITCLMTFVLQVENYDSEILEHNFSYIRANSSRILAIHRNSVKGSKTPNYVTVFEYLGEGKALRTLYEMKLASSSYSFTKAISPDGRFFITMDETSAIGTGPHSLIIYDLARKEFTAYSCKDFMSADLYNSLAQHAIFPGLRWHSPHYMFNRDSTKFYPTEIGYFQRRGKAENIPFVEVDLLTRTVKVIEVPKISSADISQKVEIEGAWIPSDEVVETENTILPKSFTRTFGDLPDLKYELDANKADYVPVDTLQK